MTYVAPRTWAIGDLATNFPTYLNQDLRDDQDALRGLNLCAAKVFRTSNQSISSSTGYTAVSWQSSAFTAGSPAPWVIGSPTRFTAPVAGRYLVVGNACWANNNSGRRALGFGVNGSVTYGLQKQESNGVDTCTGMTIIELAAGDYVEMRVFQNSGGALNLTGGTEQNSSCYFQLLGGIGSPAAWVAPKTWVDGSPQGILTGALLNTYVRDNTDNLYNLKGASAALNLDADQSVSQDSREPITWNVEQWDLGNISSGNSGDLVAPVDGYYLVTLSLEWDADSNADGVRGCGYTINARNIHHDMQFQEGNANQLNTCGADLVMLSAGDVIQFYGFQDSGESLSLHGGNADQTNVRLTLIAEA